MIKNVINKRMKSSFFVAKYQKLTGVNLLKTSRAKRTKGVEMPYKKCWLQILKRRFKRIVCQNHKACKNAFQI
jgi:hypothetical protein